MKNEVKKNEEKVASGAETALVEGELGEIKIHENVIANLVSRAAQRVEGVSRLAGSTIVDAIAGIVGSRRMQARAISIEMGEDNRVAVELKINILVGYKLPEVAQEVQKNVISDIESTTGMTVTKVNVAVQEIDDRPEESTDESDTDAGAMGAGVVMP